MVFRDLYEIVAEGVVGGELKGLSLAVVGRLLRASDFDAAEYCERELAAGFKQQLGVAPSVIYWRVPGGD